MHSKTWFALPLAVKLSTVHLSEDILLDGDLQDVYASLVKDYIFVVKNKKLKAKICKTYTKNSSLWDVTSDIMERFHLLPVISVSEDGIFSLTFEKGSAWKGE